MLDTLHDGFFYLCYGLTALILLHRALAPTAVIGEGVDDPQGEEFVNAAAHYAAFWEKMAEEQSSNYRPAAPATMSTHTATVTLGVDDYSVRQLRAIAKERANGRVKNYKNISKGALFGQLRELRLV